MPYGETSDYLTARFARDGPDVLERMKAGEFKSRWAAAVRKKNGDHASYPVTCILIVSMTISLISAWSSVGATGKA